MQITLRSIHLLSYVLYRVSLLISIAQLFSVELPRPIDSATLGATYILREGMGQRLL
jgi:hypothetical protein